MNFAEESIENMGRCLPMVRKEEANLINFAEKIACHMIVYGGMFIALSTFIFILYRFFTILFWVYNFIPGGMDWGGIQFHSKTMTDFETSVDASVLSYFPPNDDGILAINIILYFYVTAIGFFFIMGRFVRNTPVSASLHLLSNSVIIGSVLFFSTLTVYFTFLLFASVLQLFMVDILSLMTLFILWYAMRLPPKNIRYFDLWDIIFVLVLFSFFYSWWSLESAGWFLGNIFNEYHLISMLVFLVFFIFVCRSDKLKKKE